MLTISCFFQIHPTDCLPGMICDSCIVQLNVAYSFKMKAIESDTKLHQYVIEKGFGMQDTSCTLAITESQHSCNSFTVPQPLHQTISQAVIQATDNVTTTAAIQQEYLRHFETPQSMASLKDQRPTSQNDKLPGQQPFPCMPIQIKIEPLDSYLGSSEVSPATSDENLQALSNTGSIRSNENLSGSSMVCVNKKTSSETLKSSDNSSDKSIINAYISSGPSTSGMSDITKTSSTKSSMKTNSPEVKIKPVVMKEKRSKRLLQTKEEEIEKRKKEEKALVKKPKGRPRSDTPKQKKTELESSSNKQGSKGAKDAVTTRSGRRVSLIMDLKPKRNKKRETKSQGPSSKRTKT